MSFNADKMLIQLARAEEDTYASWYATPIGAVLFCRVCRSSFFKTPEEHMALPGHRDIAWQLYESGLEAIPMRERMRLYNLVGPCRMESGVVSDYMTETIEALGGAVIGGRLCAPPAIIVLLKSPLGNDEVFWALLRAMEDKDFLAALDSAMQVSWRALVLMVAQQQGCDEHYPEDWP